MHRELHKELKKNTTLPYPDLLKHLNLQAFEGF